MRDTFLLLLLFQWCLCGAVALRPGKWCFEGCELTLNYANFNDTGPGSKKIRSCRSGLRATSLYLCIDEYCEGKGIVDWLRAKNETCGKIANATLPPYDVVAKMTPEERAGVHRLTASEALARPTLDIVIVPDDSFLERAYTTLDAAYGTYNLHRVYGWCMYYFWAVVFSISIGTRLISLIRSLWRQEWQPISTDPDEPNISGRCSTTSTLYTLLKRYIITPAAFNDRCAQPLGWCTIPPRIQSLTISCFVALNVILCTIGYFITHGNLYWPQEREQLLRYVSDRTGILSLANFPLIWLFGTRNNALLWVTGWDFGAYSNFHRWVARVSTLQAVVHSIGYTLMICESGGWTSFKKYLGKHYFWNGEVATLAMCGLLAFSVYGLRRRHYEIFLTAHIVGSTIVLLTMYYHVEIFTDGEWNVFIYPCLFIWIFDRILRALRILAFNPRFWNTEATATYDASSNLVRLEVPRGESWLEPKPGTYYYIYVLNDMLYAHQNHPFTLAYATKDKNDDYDGTKAIDLQHYRPSPRRTSSSESHESDALLSSTSTQNTSPSLVFLVRPYDGFTSRLARKASRGLASLRVLIEGPYGHTVPLREFPNILFVVGGTGIAVPLSHIASLLSEGSGVLSLRIIWAVREHAFLASMLREFRGMLADERVMLEVHVTQDEECKDDALDGKVEGVKLEAGRPLVHDVVEQAAREAGRERLAVVACGPAQMADQARRASVDLLADGYRGVEYFEESFKW